jgi:hypothetical protein
MDLAQRIDDIHEGVALAPNDPPLELHSAFDHRAKIVSRCRSR